MSPRADDTPRRGRTPRRGTSGDLPFDDGGEPDQDGRSRGFGGIGDARAYTPRGRTVAERDQRTRSPRAGRTVDPFRPALQVLDGGEPPRGRGRAGDAGAGRAGDAGAGRADQPAPEQRRDAARERRRGEPELHDSDDSGRRRSPARRGEHGDEPDDGRLPTGRNRGTTRERGRSGPAERGGSAQRRSVAGASRPRVTADPRPGRPVTDPRTGRGAGEPRAGHGAGEARAGRGVGEARAGRGAGEARAGRGVGLRGGTGSAGARTGKGGPDPRTGRKATPRRRVTVAAEPPKLANGTRRLRLGTVMALSLFVMIGIRLVVLQVASSPDDRDRLIKLRESRTTEVVLPAARGSILDRNGSVLAHSVEARYIATDPVLVQDPATTAARLSPLIGVPVSALIPLLTPHQRPGGGQSRFEYLAQGVDISVGDRIAAMKLHGIIVRQDERRDVPGADLAANLIGFTGADNSGLEGLESRYDSLLRGTDGERVYEIGNGDLNKPIPGGYHRETEPQPGTSLELTIDSDVQFEVQRILAEQAQKWHATMAGAVVLDVRTGEVIAQASYPSYDPAKAADYPPTAREDVPTSVVADPGSIHKAFTIGAALQEGVITPNSIQVVGPALERGGYRFQDSHMQPRGTKMTIPGILAYSSNVGTILIADKLGKQKLYEYQRKFGLGQATNEGMPGEASGKILTPDEWSASASGSVPIGMSVDATLVQMAAGYAAIADDGTYIQPHLIKELISGKDGTVTAAPAPETHQVLSPAVAAELRLMMEAVVDNTGATGTQASVTGYRVAGKTGTGKRLIDGQYTSYNYGSFIGMAPAENPRFVVAVSADVPHGTGGDVAAPAFSRMMSFALLHYRVPPSTTKPPKFKIHP